jgi:hypothetical protein
MFPSLRARTRFTGTAAWLPFRGVAVTGYVAKKLPDQLLQVVFNISNAVAAAALLSAPIFSSQFRGFA